VGCREVFSEPPPGRTAVGSGLASRLVGIDVVVRIPGWSAPAASVASHGECGHGEGDGRRAVPFPFVGSAVAVLLEPQELWSPFRPAWLGSAALASPKLPERC